MKLPIHRLAALAFLLALALFACAPAAPPRADAPAATAVTQRMGGPGSGMMARHHAQIPPDYAGLTNPIPPDQASLTRGAAHYATYCVNCHGAGGMGDGVIAQSLDPAPAPIAHTSRMLGDDYLFWRISEGGLHEPFTSAMPRWQDLLDQNDRWDVINYVRALGNGTVLPGQGPGAAFDPAAEAARHEAIAAEGLAQGVLTQQQADAFLSVHAQLDTLMAAARGPQQGGMDAQQEAMLQELLAAGRISPSAADHFRTAHELLLAAGLME